jgi:hypothetical protein
MHLRSCIMTVIISIAAISFVQGQGSATLGEAPSAMEKAYGDKGTFELGINGMVGLAKSTGSVTDSSGNVEGFPMKTFSGSFSLFGKYYIVERIHVGGSIVGNFQLNYNDANEIINGNGLLSFYGEGGYSIPITKGVVLDLSGGIGFAELFITFDPIPAIIYNLKPMLLFPVGENALIGVGAMLTSMNIDHYMDDVDDPQTVKLNMTNLCALAQISIYF